LPSGRYKGPPPDGASLGVEALGRHSLVLHYAAADTRNHGCRPAPADSGSLFTQQRVLATATVVLGVTAAFASPGSGTTTTIPGCAPQCLTPNLAQPGFLAPGTYRTRFFFGGQMTLSFAKEWYSGEDSTGEFWASPKANSNARVIFWEDVYATTSMAPGDPQRVGPLRRTSASLLAWLRKNPNLTVSKPTSGKIGALRARVVDIGVSAGAVNDDPGCPAKACANFLRFPQWGEPYGIAGKAMSRFYFADVRYGGKSHLFVAVVEAGGAAQLKAFLPTAKKVIGSVRVPATSG
jgi:hypothetical protein